MINSYQAWGAKDSAFQQVTVGGMMLPQSPLLCHCSSPVTELRQSQVKRSCCCSLTVPSHPRGSRQDGHGTGATPAPNLWSISIPLLVVFPATKQMWSSIPKKINTKKKSKWFKIIRCKTKTRQSHFTSVLLPVVMDHQKDPKGEQSKCHNPELFHTGHKIKIFQQRPWKINLPVKPACPWMRSWEWECAAPADKCATLCFPPSTAVPAVGRVLLLVCPQAPVALGRESPSLRSGITGFPRAQQTDKSFINPLLWVQ